MTPILFSRHATPAICGALDCAATTISKGGVLELLLEPGRWLQCWRARVAYRHDLGRLLATGPHLVRDLGLDAADVSEEVGKPFWRA